MKIRDIYNLFTKEDVKLKTALRVFGCSPSIKKHIGKWLETGNTPNVEYELPVEVNGEAVSLSSFMLIEEFGMSELEALLFIDWAKSSRQNAVIAMKKLHNRDKGLEITITDEMRSRIEPDVKVEIEKIKAQEMEELKALRMKYNKIADEEL